jgi:hypothetical protein
MVYVLMHPVLPPFANRRTLLTFVTIWFVLLAGFYLWSVRGLLGFQGTDYFTIETNSSSGKVYIVCSIQTPVRPSRRNELRCEVKAPPTNIAAAPSYPIQVEMAVSGDGFLVSPSDQHTVLKSDGSQLLTFGVEPISSGDRNLVIGASVADTVPHSGRLAWS